MDNSEVTTYASITGSIWLMSTLTDIANLSVIHFCKL